MKVNGAISARVRLATIVALRHAPPAARRPLATLFALEQRIAGIAASASNPMIGRMRLAWWREALTRLDAGPAPAEPLLRRIEADLLPRGITGAALAVIVDGWEEIVAAEGIDRAILTVYGTTGRGLFAAAARLLDSSDAAIPIAGEAWSLATLAAALGPGADGPIAQELALQRFDTAFLDRWPTSARALGVLAMLAVFDLSDTHRPIGDLWRILRFRVTGR